MVETLVKNQKLWQILSLLIFLGLHLEAYLNFEGFRSGDSSIYFTFFKNFFHWPFSFHPSTVSYGATSPLYAFIGALFFQGGLESSVRSLDILNFLFLGGSSLLLWMSGDRTPGRLILISFFTTFSVPLLLAIGESYESGLLHFTLSALIYLKSKRSENVLIFLSGLLHLVRPELLLLTGLVFLESFSRSREKLKSFLLMGLAMGPVVLYYSHMFWYTNSLVPSSAYGRMITALETDLSYLDRLIVSYRPLFESLSHLIYLMGCFAFFFFFRKTWERFGLISLFPIFLVGVFVLSPPLSYLPRYLLPVLPFFLLSLSELVVALFSNELPKGALSPRFFWLSVIIAGVFIFLLAQFGGSANIALFSTFAGAIIFAFLSKSTPYRKIVLGLLGLTIFMSHASTLRVYRRKVFPYSYDILLGQDFAKEMNQISGIEDRVLLYEIQHQFYLNAQALSLDAIVGKGEVVPFLTQKVSFKEFLKAKDIRFIVTMNSFVYRKSLNLPSLVALYEHDLNSDVDERVEIEGVWLKKVKTNPAFRDPSLHSLQKRSGLNSGDQMRVFSDQNSAWAGHTLLWNSIYEVEVN